MAYSILLGLVFAAALGLSTAQTKYCCAPDQWEGLVATITNQGGRIGRQIRTTAYVFYDLTNQRTAVFFNSTQSSGEQFFFEVLTLFNVSSSTGTIYYLNLKTKECSVINITTPISNYCVPDTAHKLGDVTLGADGESLPVSVFLDIEDGVEVVYTFTQNLCIPVSQLMTSDEKLGNYMNVAEFANIKTTINQTSVFNVPPECKHARLMFTPEESFVLQFPSMLPNIFSIKRHFL